MDISSVAEALACAGLVLARPETAQVEAYATGACFFDVGYNNILWSRDLV
jgi:hypothetical protein